MSPPILIRKLGEERTRRITIGKGFYKGPKTDEVLEVLEPVEIDVVEYYHFRYENIKENNPGEGDKPLWWHRRYLWDTVSRPGERPNSPPAPPEKPVKLPWWRRLFGQRIPRARVVQR